MSSLKSFVLVLSLLAWNPVHADIELPRGSLAGCPFIHEDEYDLAPLLDTLKVQLEARIQGKNKCLQSMQSIYSNLSSLQFFYSKIDPALRQKLAKGVYANAIVDLENRKATLEAMGQTGSAEYSIILSEISQFKSLNLTHEVDLNYYAAFSQANQEALFRTQLLSYTSNLLNAYTATARTQPQCIDTLGGWNQALAALLGGFSLATGVGLNPNAEILGASATAAVQLVNLLKDIKVRSAYNDLIRLKNYKTLACTYYAIQRSTCEYRRAYRISENVNDLREFYRNQFDSQDRLIGEYNRYFVNLGRISRLGDIFRGVAQMGSALTFDQGLLQKYFSAKLINFQALGTPPAPTSPPGEISRWLIQARASGISYSEYNPQNGGTLTLQEQLALAMTDMSAKLATIEAVDKLLSENTSFLDTRRFLSANYPAAVSQVREMLNYLTAIRGSSLVSPENHSTLLAAEVLLEKLLDFLSVEVTAHKTTEDYEDQVIRAGSAIFAELAKGAIAQLTSAQSVFALSEKGMDRLNWAFKVIQNGYLDRDLRNPPPPQQSFIEYSKKYNILAKVIEDYNSFHAGGSTFRSQDYLTAVKSFRRSFKNEMLKSLELAEEDGIPEVAGVTRAHLCALYAPTLRTLANEGLFKGGRAGRILADCEANYKTLGTNRLVADADFTVDYEDDCTYINYNREIEIQRLIAQLIRH